MPDATVYTLPQVVQQVQVIYPPALVGRPGFVDSVGRFVFGHQPLITYVMTRDVAAPKPEDHETLAEIAALCAATHPAPADRGVVFDSMIHSALDSIRETILTSAPAALAYVQAKIEALASTPLLP